MLPDRPAGDQCRTCTFPASRREFIRNLTLSLSAAFGSLSLSPEVAAAMPLRAAAPSAIDREKHTYPIPPADGVHIDRKSEVILVRWQNVVYAFNLACPHQNVALRWIDKDRRFKCPKHNSRYEPDGTFVDGRATRGMDRLGIALEGANVVVNIDALHKQDEDAAGWGAAAVRLPAGQSHEPGHP